MREYTEEELRIIKIQILSREVTLCEDCGTLFNYEPRKWLCVKCVDNRRIERTLELRKTKKYKLSKSQYDKRHKRIKKILKTLQKRSLKD